MIKKKKVFSFFSWSFSCFLDRFLGRVLFFLPCFLFFLVEFFFSFFFLFSFTNSRPSSFLSLAWQVTPAAWWTRLSLFFAPCLIPVFRGLATLAAEPELAVILVLDRLNQVQRQTLENLWKKEDWHCLGAAQSYWIYHMMSIFLTDLFPHKGLSPIGPYFHITTVYYAEICISAKIGYPVCAPHPAIIRFTHLFIKHILQQTYFCSKVNECMYEKLRALHFPIIAFVEFFIIKLTYAF